MVRFGKSKIAATNKGRDMKAILSFIILSLLAGVAHATPYGVITANEFMSMDLSKTWMLPPISDTLAGVASVQTLSNKTFANPVFNIFQGVQQTTPACPPPGSNDLYFKSDNNLYTLTSACVETQLGTGGGGGSGTVTSVGLVAPAWLTVTNSPVTTSGNLTLLGTSEPANEVLASPNGSSGALAPRLLVAADIPSLAYAPQTSGGSILYGNGAGGFLNVTIGANLTFSGGTLSATGGGGGSSGYVVSSISTNASLAAGSPLNQQHVSCDATGGAVVASLPACVSGIVGQYFNLKKIDSSSNSCGYLANGSDVIDGQASLSTTNQYVGFAVVCRTAGFWDIL
jgi:hypothetical protein